MESNKINAELQEIEQSLIIICQNTIKQTVKKQHESITEEFENTKTKLLANRNSTLIKLNVGGKKFTTCLSTLTSDPESNLTKMFSGELPIAKDKDVYFLDRNAEYFSYVLDYLRDPTSELPKDFGLSMKIKEEMEFFGITKKTAAKGPVQGWGWDTTKHFGITMTNDNLTVTKTQNTTFGVAYGDTSFTSGVYRWKIIVSNVANSYWISAGLFSESELPSPASFSYTTCWGFSSYGNLYRMTGSGTNVKLVTGDVFEMEYDADTGEFHLKVENRGVDIVGTIPKNVQNVKPFTYVWTMADSLTLSFD